MQAYLVKATYTNNVYKISDFFLSGDYKKDPNKEIDLNFRPDDGLSLFITKNITLGDGSSIRDHTHVIIPDHDKIYKILSTDYINSEQYQLTVDEDPFIGQYLNLKSQDIFLTRTNDSDLFRGINDISDLSIKETISSADLRMITPDIKFGKVALLFFQVADPTTPIGLKFNPAIARADISETTFANLTTNYDEVLTDTPEIYDYYLKLANVSGTLYQCVYNHSTGRLNWVLYQTKLYTDYYIDISGTIPSSKLNDADVYTVCIALPFENTLIDPTKTKFILNYEQFVGPIGTNLIDVKIVNDLFFDTFSYTESYNATTKYFEKSLIFNQYNVAIYKDYYQDSALTTLADKKGLVVMGIIKDIDISQSWGTSYGPLYAEPFYKYELYVFGKKYQIPSYLSDDLHLLISINSGVINYLIYYNTKQNVLASGSFTHSIKYQIDQLDAFYSQNPTYKEQFFAKMAIDSIKTVAGAGIAGTAVPGFGTIAGIGTGLLGAGVDAGISMLNLHYMEKGLKLKPDQMFGENSEITLQMEQIFGIYWIRKLPENIDLMMNEYYLKGFPTNEFLSIDDLSYKNNTRFGNNKIVFGELKSVIRNEYTTAFINEKLKQGVILVE